LFVVVTPSLSDNGGRVSASNVCICECCDGSSCARGSNGTFTISGTCDDCTARFCEDNYAEKCNGTNVDKSLPPVNVVANCINRDHFMFPLAIVFFLFITTLLYAVALARFAFPKLRKEIARGA